MNRLCRAWMLCGLILTSTAAWAADINEATVEQSSKLTPKRLAELTAMLEPTPTVPGPTIADRAAWTKLAATGPFGELIPKAEALLDKPVPALPDALYLEYSRMGRRSGYESPLRQRRGRLTTLVMAECMENAGRFLPAIEATLRETLRENTWVLPAHDRKLENFRGERMDIDLGAASAAWTLATTAHLLGDTLSDDVRTAIRAEIERRVWGPFRRMVETGQDLNWWLTTTNNWNAVCLAGVVGSALTLIESPADRAIFVAGAEIYSPSFLAGFSPCGYCSEGVGYWNYGFGHFIMLSEVICQATGGKLDLLAQPKAKEAAQFGRRIEILPGVYPAFADCSPGSKPARRYMDFVSRRYRLGWYRWQQEHPDTYSMFLYETALLAFENSARRAKAADALADSPPLRSWFPTAGILACRPTKVTDPTRAFGVAVKGGNNNEHHNHNDVGSFVVAVGDATPIVDPGGEIYTARTFSANRYDSNVLNSRGHSVPVVAGRLQETGADAKAIVVDTELTDDIDTLVLDLRPAYDVDGIIKLQRTFEYARFKGGSLTVTDEAAFGKPRTFGTALITFGEWSRNDDGSLTITDGDTSVLVTLETTGGPIEIEAETIHEDLRGKRLPTRIGINFANPSRYGLIKMTIRPK